MDYPNNIREVGGILPFSGFHLILQFSTRGVGQKQTQFIFRSTPSQSDARLNRAVERKWGGTENVKNRAQNTQSHGVLNMKAWLKLNNSRTFAKRARARRFLHSENLKSLQQPEPELITLNKIGHNLIEITNYNNLIYKRLHWILITF